MLISPRVLRVNDIVGLAAGVILLFIVAFPPRTWVPSLPKFFFFLGVLGAYASLLSTIARMRGVPVTERGVPFAALALILASSGASRIVSLPLLAASLIIRFISLYRGKPQASERPGTHTAESKQH